MSADIRTACMRMRRLGNGQSVVFCVPKDIETKILEQTSIEVGSTVKVADVLGWAVSETCADLKRSIPLWAAQGLRFENQKLFWTAAQSDNGFDMSRSQAEKFLEGEAQTLAHHYCPSAQLQPPPLPGAAAGNDIHRIRERCLEFESADVKSAALQEEQERELSPEIEQERQVERPAGIEPEEHCIHKDVQTFAETGGLVGHSNAFLPAFTALQSSSAAGHFDTTQFPSDILVTADFARTVKLHKGSDLSDAYQRSVQWILTSVGTECSDTVKHMIIISPFEAYRLLPLVRKHRRVTLHIYAPRPNREFRCLDQLDLFTEGRPFDHLKIPSPLLILLNLFAGQLYMSSFEEYVEVCQFLGLAWRAAEDDTIVGADGFIAPTTGNSRFKRSPVQFLKVLTTKIRRNCEDIGKTHMGKVLGGMLLEEEDFKA